MNKVNNELVDNVLKDVDKILENAQFGALKNEIIKAHLEIAGLYTALDLACNQIEIAKDMLEDNGLKPISTLLEDSPDYYKACANYQKNNIAISELEKLEDGAIKGIDLVVYIKNRIHELRLGENVKHL